MPEDLPASNQQPTTGGQLHWQPPKPERLAVMLPQYEIEALIGHGGMGAVYRGRQKSLDRPVAIKILPPEAAGDADTQFVQRFKNEARTMAKMNHPGIVQVYDFGETSEGQLYIVMEFIDGTDVAKMIESQGRLSPEHALAITAHVCDALHYAHKLNVIHRDIKPANIMINLEGTVKVADFGLAKANDPTQSGLTKTNMAMGTPDFVAPEALTLGMTVDDRADLYAVGVMLYQMLTGSIPRGLWEMPGTLLKTDPRFDAIISRAMQTDREARYQSAVELRRDLDVILTTPQATRQHAPKTSAAAPGPEGSQNAAAGRGALTRAPAKRSQAPLFIGLGLGLAAALVLGAFFAMRSSDSQIAPQKEAVSENHDVAVPAKVPEDSTAGPAASMPKVTKTAEPSAVPTAAPPTGVLTWAGHRYQLVMDRLNWEKARAKAAAMGGHLAVIDTKEKLDWAWDKFASKLLKTPGDQGSDRIYIGLHKSVEMADWAWVTGSPLQVQPWMGQVPETKQGVGYVATIHGQRLDFVRPKVFPPAPFLVEWDDKDGAEPAMTATPKSEVQMPAANLSRAVDLLALADVTQDAEGGIWHREGTDLKVSKDPAAEKNRGIKFGFALPVVVKGSYQIEVEFTKHGPAGTVSMHLPLVADHSGVLAHFQEFGPYAGLTPVRGLNTRDPGNPTRTPHQLEDGRRYRATVQVLLNGAQADIAVSCEGKPLFRFQGPVADLGKSKAAPADQARPTLRSIDPVTWHKVQIRPLNAGSLTPVRLGVILPANGGAPGETLMPTDPYLRKLETGFQARFLSDVLQPHDAALAALNQSYVINGLARARAAAQARGSLPEISALEAEQTAVEKGVGVPFQDASDTPESLKTLRAAYRGAVAKILAEREAKAAPLLDLYLKALETYVVELTRTGKTQAAQQVQTVRDTISALRPLPEANKQP